MSSRPDGDSRRPAPEDDWFASPDDWFSSGPDEPHTAPAETLWEDDEDEPAPVAAGPPGLGRRQLTVVVAALGIVAVIAVAILLVRSFGGSDSSATPTTSVDTTPVTAPSAGTTPSTGTSTTGTSTTGTTTTGTSTTGTTTTGTTTTGTTTTGTSTTATVTSVPTGQTLKAGMTGSSVLALQQALAQLGYEPGTPDGNFGAGTTAAVTAFQKDNGLTQDGAAGPQTLDKINAALARG